MNLILQEAVPRGFLSNYTTILTSFRGLIQKDGISADNIFISSTMFSLYGNPKNWFDSTKVRENLLEGDVEFSSTIHYDFDPWPTNEQLTLKAYFKFFPYNERIERCLESNLPNIQRGLGIHFRGTDHSYHVDEVPLEHYFNSIENEFSQSNYETVFLCSDEEGAILELQRFFKARFNFTDVIVNNVTRSKTKSALHLSNYDSETKIKLGDEVLLDSHSLSFCDTILGKTSNLVSYARILNPHLKVLYQDKGYNFRR